MKKLLNVLFTLIAIISLAACGGETSKTTPTGDNPTNPSTPDKTSEVLPKEDDKVHLYILTGQSGARGKALNADLSEEDKEINYDVDIMADGYMMPQLNNIKPISDSLYLKELEPGFGDAAAEFGPEIGMGQTLASRYPKDGEARKSVIIKYTACGSTFTDHWYSQSMLEDESIAESINMDQIRTNPVTEEATGPLTDNLYRLITATVEALNGEGYETVIDGAAFVHGEQDAKYDANMAIYEKALEYFIKDLRAYVGNDKLPVVVTEALTNSAKYSNELRAIQARVAQNDENVTLISTGDLVTNTFEPWHFGAQSNIVLGNRIAAELIAFNDTRKITSIDENPFKAPIGVNVQLPAYVKATFENGYSGYIKANYKSSYDSSKAGEQEVEFTSYTGNGTVTSKLKVNVSNEPFVDGVLNEDAYMNAKKHTIEGIGDIYVVKGEEGIYFAAAINDKELLTDGEAWNSGDMGQNGMNDDFRIYLTTTDASARYSIMLSAANLLRIYEPGVSLTDTGLPKKNLVNTKNMSDFKYRAVTSGFANDEGKETSNGFIVEIYISYYDLEVENPDDIKLLFEYNNVSLSSGTRANSSTYYAQETVNEKNPEQNDKYYFAISSLME